MNTNEEREERGRREVKEKHMHEQLNERIGIEPVPKSTEIVCINQQQISKEKTGLTRPTRKIRTSIC